MKSLKTTGLDRWKVSFGDSVVLLIPLHVSHQWSQVRKPV